MKELLGGALWGMPLAAVVSSLIAPAQGLVVAFYVSSSIAIATTLIVLVLERRTA